MPRCARARTRDSKIHARKIGTRVAWAKLAWELHPRAHAHPHVHARARSKMYANDNENHSQDGHRIPYTARAQQRVGREFASKIGELKLARILQDGPCLKTKHPPPSGVEGGRGKEYPPTLGSPKLKQLGPVLVSTGT